MENKKSNDDKKEKKESEFYYALGHEIRREIIRIIGENGHSSFTQLKKNLKVSTGTIYHHLDTLSKLIEQRNNKKYHLTELGEYAFESLINNEKKIGGNLRFQFTNKYLNVFFNNYSEIIYPSNKRSMWRLYVISLVLIVFGMILNGLNGFNSFLLFFTRSPEMSNNFFNAVTFVINLVIFYAIIEGICRLIFKNNDNTLLLLSSFSLILSPMIFYSIIHLILQSSDLLSNSIFYFIDRSFFISLQVLSLWFLSYHLNILKQMKINQGLTLSLILHLAGFAIIFTITVQF